MNKEMLYNSYDIWFDIGRDICIDSTKNIHKTRDNLYDIDIKQDTDIFTGLYFLIMTIDL